MEMTLSWHLSAHSDEISRYIVDNGSNYTVLRNRTKKMAPATTLNGVSFPPHLKLEERVRFLGTTILSQFHANFNANYLGER